MSMYPYEVDNSYAYDFNNSNTAFSKVEMNNGHFTLQASDTPRTVLLQIDLKPSWLGKIFQPYIEIKSKTALNRQYFEYGAGGTRYINLTPFGGETEQQIELAAENVSFASTQATLFSVTNQEIKGKTILVLAPHPDDAEIAAYGLYSDSNTSFVVTVTAGEAGPFNYDELYDDAKAHYVKKGLLRTWDSIVTPMLGGVPPQRCINLGYFDSTLSDMYLHRTQRIQGKYTELEDPQFFRKLNISSLAGGLSGSADDWESLVANLKYLLETIRPDIIVTVYPRLDRHPDHKYSTVALIEALKSLGIKDGQLFLYATHYVLSEYYPYGEIGSLVSLPPHFGTPVYFDALYSLQLSEDRQVDKVLAFEEMHDLRLDTEWRSAKGACMRGAKSFVKEIFNKNWEDYYQRFIRKNEFFFVVDIKNLYKDEILSALYGYIPVGANAP